MGAGDGPLVAHRAGQGPDCNTPSLPSHPQPPSTAGRLPCLSWELCCSRSCWWAWRCTSSKGEKLILR